MLDISPLGAGLELFSVAANEPIEGVITLLLELRGDTRNSSRSKELCSARVGIQFPEATEGAKLYLREMNGAKSRW